MLKHTERLDIPQNTETRKGGVLVFTGFWLVWVIDISDQDVYDPSVLFLNRLADCLEEAG